jgi:type I restriction enzyme, S subunit
MKKWKEYKLNEIGYVSRGKSKHRPRDAAFLYGGQYPFIQTGDVKNAEFYITSHTQTYSEEGLKQSKLWSKGTLCITIAANVAETAILGFDACFPDSILGFIAYETEADTIFVKYYLDTLKVYLQGMSKGTTQDNLSVEKLLSIKLNLPPLSIQQKIATILGNYDALIENNEQQIRVLETTAQEIYKEWFVRGRCPFGEKDDKEKIPKEWAIKKLGDILELKYGKSLVEENRIHGKFPVIGSSGIIDFHNEFIVEKGGIVVGRKGNVGSVFWIDTSFYPIDTAFYVQSQLSLFYLFYNLKTQNFISGDSAVPGLNREQALLNLILVPSNEALAAFDKIIEPIFKQISNLQRQITTLRHTRDALLPRLLRGELLSD